MALLKNWLERLPYQLLCGTVEVPVTDVVYDSRKAGPDTVFVCMTGTRTDSHTFLAKAAEQGCRSFVVERPLEALELPGPVQGDGFNIIRVDHGRSALAYLSAARFDYPAEKLCLIGLTGTKGKTTTAYMIRDMLEHAGKRTGIIGTNGCEYAGKHFSTNNTTPESYELCARFREMLEAGCTHVVMECSSQGFKMHRTDGLVFDYGLFLNLSPDHIGPLEHADFSEYLACKAKLLAQSRVGIVNADDPHTAAVLQASKRYFQSPEAENRGAEAAEEKIATETAANNRTEAGVGTKTVIPLPDSAFVSREGVPLEPPLKAVYTYGIRENLKTSAVLPSLYAGKLCYEAGADFTGVSFQVHGLLSDQLRLPLPGEFNVSNALAAIAVCTLLGIPKETINEALLSIHVSGRMETVFRSAQLQVLVDYAHNAVSMESLLKTLRAYRPKRLVVVFGSGGNRAKDRRSGMGKAAAQFADFSILTNDNPRDEEPEAILADIRAAYLAAGGREDAVLEIPDRRAAIRYAMRTAQSGDMIAVIGKGHEAYQEIRGVRSHFSDREEILAAAKELGLSDKGAKNTI